MDLGDLAAGGARLQALHVSVRQQRKVGITERWIDTDDLRIRLAVHQAGKAVERVATNAGARMQRFPVLFRQQNAQRQWKGVKTLAHERVMQLLDAWFVADRRIGIRLARRRVGRVDPVLAMHAVEMLGLGIVWLEIVVSERPGGRETPPVAYLARKPSAPPGKRRPPPLWIF